MPSALLRRKSITALKTEATFGTFAAPLAADLNLRLYRSGAASIIKLDGNLIRRDKPGGFGFEGNMVGNKHVTFNAMTYLQGSGGAGLPAIGKLLTAAGLASDGGGNYTSSRSDASWTSFSAAEYVDGRLNTGRGIMTNLVFEFTNGDPVKVTAAGMGGYNANSADAAMLTGTYEPVTPPNWSGAGAVNGFTFGGVALKVANASLDLGNDIQLREDVNPPAVEGYLMGYLGNSAPTVTIDPESATKATRDFFAQFVGGNTADLVWKIGTAVNNSITITAKACQLSESPDEGERGGRLVEALKFDVTGDVVVAFA